jgi:hypothetical protein
VPDVDDESDGGGGTRDDDGGGGDDVARAAARSEELAEAASAVEAARKAGPASPPSMFGGLIAAAVDAVAPSDGPLFRTENVPEEAAGWLHRRGKRGAWARAWVVLRVNAAIGPFLEVAARPDIAIAERVVLAGCEVAVDESGDGGGARFAFVITHPHQAPCHLASLNQLTRKQWVSVLLQLVRDHARNARQSDQGGTPADRRLKTACRRLSLARAREEGAAGLD